MGPQRPTLVGVEEFAAMTGLSVCNVRRMCRSGVLPAVKVGRRWLIGLEKALGAAMRGFEDAGPKRGTAGQEER